MMARKKNGEMSTSGRSRSVTISAAATLETATPYLRTADVRCAERPNAKIPCPPD
jgi:hypothetical protein